MEEKSQKELIYKCLLELTKIADDQNKYFSVTRILKGNGFFLNGSKLKIFRVELERLVAEGRVRKVIAEIGIEREPYTLYRAAI